jgi:hypothetical protein
VQACHCVPPRAQLVGNQIVDNDFRLRAHSCGISPGCCCERDFICRGGPKLWLRYEATRAERVSTTLWICRRSPFSAAWSISQILHQAWRVVKTPRQRLCCPSAGELSPFEPLWRHKRCVIHSSYVDLAPWD